LGNLGVSGQTNGEGLVVVPIVGTHFTQQDVVIIPSHWTGCSATIFEMLPGQWTIYPGVADHREQVKPCGARPKKTSNPSGQCCKKSRIGTFGNEKPLCSFFASDKDGQ
jgi:hypothetical protein